METVGIRPGRARERRCVPALLIGAILAVGGCSSGQPSATSTTTPEISSCDATTVAQKVLPSVVTISASNGTILSTGSGEVIRDSGEIVTNNHVIAIAATAGTIDVLFSNGTRAPATVTGRDPQTDLAVIKVSTGQPLPPISLGTSDAVHIGEPVVALGAPLGLTGSVTSGIVSALGRTIRVPADDGRTAILLSAVQTDAAINPGNSGGALTDCSGDLIGVPTANASVTDEAGQSSVGNVGLAFAIPVDVVKAVADELIATGAVTHSYLGLQVIEVPPSGGEGSSQSEGLYVNAVDPAGPAASAGLLPGDVITAVDGQPVIDADQLAALTLSKKPGETVTITYERAGSSAQAILTLVAPPAS